MTTSVSATFSPTGFLGCALTTTTACHTKETRRPQRNELSTQPSRSSSIQRKVQRFQMRYGKLRRTGAGTFEQKRVDVLLGVDMVRLCSKKQIELAILIAGDSDLVPAVEASKEEGAIVRLYYKSQSVSDELLNVCDERYEIDQGFIDKACDPAHLILPVI
ncbi:MAG TPA: NYN domain-containing protein [Terriglobia bacterium]|nr:NYN domain-containing protein [Terriglobia bacterium]